MDLTNRIIEGTFWLYMVLLPYGWGALALMVFIIAPLSLIKKLKIYTGISYIAFSYLIGLITWLLGFGITLATLGWLAVFIGLFFFGIGVVPLAIVGLLFQGQQLDMVLSFFGMIVLIFVSRAFGAYLIGSSVDID